MEIILFDNIDTKIFSMRPRTLYHKLLLIYYFSRPVFEHILFFDF